MVSTRDQIILATCQLLEAQGYNATGLNQIIKESDTPKGSLYYYFPGGKQELAIEALKYAGDSVLSRMKESLAEVDEPAESVQKFISNIALNVQLSGYRAGGPITTIALETASSNEDLRQECQRIYDEWQQAFADKLTSGGMTDAHAKNIAALIISALEGGIVLCRTSQTRDPLESVAEEISILIAHALNK